MTIKVKSASQTVLCVDDEPEILTVRRILLEQSGYQVLTANSGAQALSIFSDHPVHIVLLDFLMPGMRGDELATKLKQQNSTVPILAVSAVAQLPRAFLETVDGYVEKGGDPEVLLATIGKLLPGAGSA